MYQEVFSLHADLLKALAHPKRLEIIQLLHDEPLSVGQIQTMLDLPQANLSQHLQILRLAGVLTCEKQGKQKFYRITHSHFSQACDLLRDVLVERHSYEPLAEELKTNIRDFLPLVTDPVCGMRLSPKTAALSYVSNGQTVYFCASGCLQKYQKDHV